MASTFSTTGGTSHSTTVSGLSDGQSYNYYVRCIDASSNANTNDFTISFSVASAADTTPPSQVSGLVATAISTSQINLTWNAATDNVAVAGYRIYMCTGAACTPASPAIATTAAINYSNTGLTASTTYNYKVEAYDTSSNYGLNSSVSDATTLSPPLSSNVAASANGGTAVSSSNYNPDTYPEVSAINGDRTGAGWGAGTGGWNDATFNVFPDWLEVNFSSLKTIREIDVFSVQDNYGSPSDPTPSMTFTLYGLVDFEIQYWTGSAWQAVPGGTITGNNLVWRKVTFSPLSTSKIRVWINQAVDAWSRVPEVEAWT